MTVPLRIGFTSLRYIVSLQYPNLFKIHHAMCKVNMVRLYTGILLGYAKLMASNEHSNSLDLYHYILCLVPQVYL